VNQYSDEIRAVLQAVADEPIGANNYGDYCVFCLEYLCWNVAQNRHTIVHEPDCIVLVARKVCDALGLEYGVACKSTVYVSD